MCGSAASVENQFTKDAWIDSAFSVLFPESIFMPKNAVLL
jgi:hypothetical protein